VLQSRNEADCLTVRDETEPQTSANLRRPKETPLPRERFSPLAEPRQLAGGGCRGVLGSVSLMHAHDGAESVQIVSEGRANSGSSRVPARKIIKCWRASDELVIGVPQRSQNCRCMRLPLSAMLAKSRSGPVTATAEAANTRLAGALPAAKY
jgi:hypothetical protein